jgi:hypothetical protein
VSLTHNTTVGQSQSQDSNNCFETDKKKRSYECQILIAVLDQGQQSRCTEKDNNEKAKANNSLRVSIGERNSRTKPSDKRNSHRNNLLLVIATTKAYPVQSKVCVNVETRINGSRRKRIDNG